MQFTTTSRLAKLFVRGACVAAGAVSVCKSPEMAKQYLINRFDEIEQRGPNYWNALFHNIQQQSYKNERSQRLTTKEAHSLANVEKNRYRDVSAFDHNRVILRDVEDGDSDYINASPIDMPNTQRKYILTQGPLPNTCNDHWQLVWENNVPAVIMLNRVYEKEQLNANGQKFVMYGGCEEYYPTSKERVKNFDTFRVELEEQTENEKYIIRKLTLINKKKIEGAADSRRSILHFQFVEWPDFGVPDSTADFLQFLDAIKAAGVLPTAAADPPVVVHCSAGIGRTGTFIVVDGVLSMIEAGVSSVDIEQLVIELRRSRTGLIQTHQQLRFCWKAIADRLKCGETRGDAGNGSSCSSPSSVRTAVLAETPSPSTSTAGGKREAEASDEADERLAKRRALVARMVARSREKEASRDRAGLSVKAMAISGLVLASAAVVYYVYRK